MKERKAKKTSLLELQNKNSEHVPHFKLAKLFDVDANWEKDELLDALHWIRQGVGLLLGLIWGAVPLVDAIWIVLWKGDLLNYELANIGFFVLSTTPIYWYYAYFLRIDEEEYGGHGALLQEGLFASFTLFLLAWILVYSLIHF